MVQLLWLPHSALVNYLTAVRIIQTMPINLNIHVDNCKEVFFKSLRGYEWHNQLFFKTARDGVCKLSYIEHIGSVKKGHTAYQNVGNWKC